MNSVQAEELVDYAKGLFRFMTPYQGKVLLTRIEHFEDPEFVQRTLEHFASNPPADDEHWQEGNLPLVAITERITAELRRRGQTTADEFKRRQREEEATTSDNWILIDRMIEELSDDDLAELKPRALLYLSSTNAREMFKEKSVRDSKTLRGLVYRVLTERGAA